MKGFSPWQNSPGRAEWGNSGRVLQQAFLYSLSWPPAQGEGVAPRLSFRPISLRG